MTTYINGGVTAGQGAAPLPTKKSLKLAIADGTPVWFYGTALFGQQYEGDVRDVPEGVSLSVVGPDPYTKRSWYAQVSKKNGKVVVS